MFVLILVKPLRYVVMDTDYCGHVYPVLLGLPETYRISHLLPQDHRPRKNVSGTHFNIIKVLLGLKVFLSLIHERPGFLKQAHDVSSMNDTCGTKKINVRCFNKVNVFLTL